MEPGQILENLQPHQVFRIPELRTMIIKHVIHDNKGKMLVDEVKNCREVCPSWTGSTTEALRQSKEPLFHFRLDENYFFEETEYRVWKLKILDLKETVAMASPPVALHVHESYFRGTHSRRLEEPLETLKDILIYIDINLRYKTSLGFYPEEFDLPMLKDLRIRFTDSGRAPAVALMQRVQQGSPALRKLTLVSDGIQTPRSDEISGITLSETLTSIDFTQVETRYCEVLTTSYLPNLKRLALRILPSRQAPVAAGLVSRILENVRHSLEYLFVAHAPLRHGLHHFRFPVMDNLTELDIDTRNVQLEPGVQSLETYLPVLASFRLNYLCLRTLRTWINSASRFPSVTKLKVDCSYDIRDHTTVGLEFTQQETSQIAETFPNLKELLLRLVFIRCNLNTFTALFREMSQLEKLKISLGNRDHDQDIWNAALLGVSLPTAERIRSTNSLGLNSKFDASASISNLSNLKELWLSAPFMRTGLDRANKAIGVDPPLVNFLFENGLMTLPHLKKLTLEGFIWTSLEMKEQWEASGRELISLDA